MPEPNAPSPLPFVPFHPASQPAWIFNVDKSPSGLPQSPSPGIHLPRDVPQKIFPLVNQKIRRAIKFLSVHRTRIVLLIFTAAFSHPPVGNVNTYRTRTTCLASRFDFSAKCKQYEVNCALLFQYLTWNHNRTINFGRNNLLKIRLFLRQLSNYPFSTNYPSFSGIG